MSHKTTLVSTAAFAAMAIIVLVGTVQTRTPESVSFSDDGVVWAPTLPSRLFENEIRWVPGDSRTTQFYVSNNTDHHGRLRLIVDSGNAELASALALSVDGGEDSGSCASLNVEAREKRRIALQLSMAAAAANESQVASAGIDLVVQWDAEGDQLCVASAGQRTNEKQEGAQP